MSNWINVDKQRPKAPCLYHDANGNIGYTSGIITVNDLFFPDRYVDEYFEEIRTKSHSIICLTAANAITHFVPVPEFDGDDAE